MKPLVERHGSITDSVSDGLLLLASASSLAFVSAATSARDANCHVEVCDLVRVLARSWDLYRACPVKVAVTQGEGQLLNLGLLQSRLVDGDEAMSRKDAALICTRRGDEEIEGLVNFSIGACMLDQASINDAACRRVAQVAAVVLHKESLIDPLVDDHKCELWRRVTFSLLTGVHLLDRCLELANLNADDCISLRVAHSVSEDHKVRGLLSVMALLECSHCLLESLLQL